MNDCTSCTGLNKTLLFVNLAMAPSISQRLATIAGEIRSGRSLPWDVARGTTRGRDEFSFAPLEGRDGLISP